MSKLIKQIIKFGVVGGSAFVIDYGLMIFLTEVMNINYLISNGLSFSASVVFNYIMSVKWVFDVKEKNSKCFSLRGGNYYGESQKRFARKIFTQRRSTKIIR